MSVGNTKTNGNKGNNYPFQLAVLQLLDQINASIGALPGVDYETRTTMYQATANGPGYSIGDIIIRYDIIDVATSTLSATIWFNQTTQTAIAAPAPANITPVSAPSSVTVINGVGGAAVNIQDGGNSITIDALALDVALSTRASSADITALSAAIVAALSPKATSADIATVVAALGPKATSVDIAAVVAALSGQATAANQTTEIARLTSILVQLDVALSTRASEATLSAFNTKYTSVSRTPSVVNVPASSAGSTTAGVQELSILVIGGGNTVGGVSIPSGTVLNYKAKAGDTVGALAYTTGAGGNRLILTYLT